MPDFRDLYHQMLDYRGHALYQDIIVPWMDNAEAAVAEFAHFSVYGVVEDNSDEFVLPMWNLYALSRINDFLLLPFQNDQRFSMWTGPQITQEQYIDFFALLGFTPFSTGTFSSFRHEVVTVLQDDDAAAPIKVVDTVWPGLMFEEMLFSRSGVVVRGGTDLIVKRIAENSMLHFTHRRLHRPTVDQSYGWGSNSQWRTSFRRDYEFDRKWIYNSDGKHWISRDGTFDYDRNGLASEERIELCKNRCFILTDRNDGDLYPYDYRFEEPMTN